MDARTRPQVACVTVSSNASIPYRLRLRIVIETADGEAWMNVTIATTTDDGKISTIILFFAWNATQTPLVGRQMDFFLRRFVCPGSW